MVEDKIWRAIMVGGTGWLVISGQCQVQSYQANSYSGGHKLQPDAGEETAKDVRRFYNKIDRIDIPTITMGSFVHPKLAAHVKIDVRRKQFFRGKELRVALLICLI